MLCFLLFDLSIANQSSKVNEKCAKINFMSRKSIFRALAFQTVIC